MHTSYSEIYYYLFNRVTDALECLKSNDVSSAQRILIEAQRETEEMYMNMTEDN